MNRIFRDRLKGMTAYLIPHRSVILLSAGLSLIGLAIGIIQPYFSKILIDQVLLGESRSLLAPLLWVLVGLLILGFALRVVNAWIYTRFSARMLFRMRQDLFDHLHRIPLSFFAKTRMGDIYSRIATDMADVQAMLTDSLPQFLFNILTLIVTAWLLVWLSPRMALMSLIVLPIGAVFISGLRPRLANLAKETAEANALISHFLYESLSNTHLVRAFHAHRPESDRLAEKQETMFRLLLRYQLLGALAGLAPTVFILLNTLIVFGYGGKLVMDGRMSVGTLVAFSIYQGRLLGPVRGLLDGVLAMQKSAVALNRVHEILDVAPAHIQTGLRVIPDKEFTGCIRFEGVAFSYDPPISVFRDLSFEIPPGRVTILMGPSGSGKSTICHLLLRLIDPDDGVIRMDGAPLPELDLGWYRRRVALVGQDIMLFHDSIWENIRFSRPDACPEEILEAARAACIDEFVRTLPNGYHEKVGDRGVRLSGGQKQRISIARAILTQPRVLILDEATAFLDSAVEDRLRITLGSLLRGRTILIITHRPRFLYTADRVVLLEAGHVRYQGPPEGMPDVGQNRHR